MLGLTMVIVGLGVVFASLLILSWIISLFSKVFPAEKKENIAAADQPVEEVPVVEAADSEEFSSTEELIAVLTAAIQASMGRNPELKIRINSFRRVSQTSPVWNTAGRNEYISNKL